MLRSNLFGGIAGLLLALDGLSVVLSRTALLDIFLQTFVIAGFGALVVDRDQVRGPAGRADRRRRRPQRGVPTLGPRPWRLVAGVMFGAACAVKWTALSFFVLFALLSMVWDRAALQSAGVSAGPRATRCAARRCPRSGHCWRRRSPPTCSATSAGSSARTAGTGIGPTRTRASTRLDLLGAAHPVQLGLGAEPDPLARRRTRCRPTASTRGSTAATRTASSPWSWLVLGRPVDFYYDGTSHVMRRVDLFARDPADRHAADVVGVRADAALARLALVHHARLACRRGVGRVPRRLARVVPGPEADDVPLLHGAARAVPDHRGHAGAGRRCSARRVRRTGDRGAATDASPRRRQWGIAGCAIYLGLVIADFAWMWPHVHRRAC